MEEEFDKYTSNYDMNEEFYRLKYNHSKRVMNLMVKYAKKLGFSERDIELAKIIGLLHDIARFEQWRIYHTFSDLESVDHADFGVQILFEDGLIKKFTDRVEDYELIKFAIKNHNKFKLVDCGNPRYMKFAKLIRDVDKMDIIYLHAYLDELKEKGTDDVISPKVMASIKNHDSVKKKDINNLNDFLCVQFSFAFDINYDICIDEFMKNMEDFYKRVEYKNKFKEVYAEIKKYIEERKMNHARN
jgi:putative nucleotidyltransferase with HDIG domain